MMLVNGLMPYGAQASIYYQYFAPVVPFVIWGSVATSNQWRPERARFALFASVAAFAAFGPLLYTGYGLPDRYASTVVASGERRSFQSLLRAIPPDGSVSATDRLLPHLAEREFAFPFPGPMLCSPEAIFHVPRTSYPEYVAVEWDDAAKGADWPSVLRSWGYETIVTSEDLAVLRLRGTPPEAVDCPGVAEVLRNLITDSIGSDG
jgi:hypothetical protein